MTIRRPLLIAIASAALFSLALASCGEGANQLAAESGNTLLSYVPENTPYLAANFEPVPEEVVEAMFRRIQPAVDSVQEALADTRIKLSGSAAANNPEAAIMGAVLDELNGKLNPQGLESLGFSMEPYQAVYGMGIFPVMRLSLASAQALRDTIGRIEASSGVEFADHDLQGQAYWKISDDASDPHGDTPVSIYLAIIEDSGASHLAMGLFPHSVEADVLPAFLGRTKPANSSATAKLAELSRKYGHTPHGTGYLDFHRLFEQFTDPSSPLRKVMEANGENPDDVLTEVCKAEIGSLIDRAPRMVIGSTEMTSSAMGVEYRLELADDLASDLAALVSNVPAAPSQSDRLLEFAFGIRIGAARDFLITKATALSQQNFECEHLEKINETASAALVKLNYPMPPLINNFLGLRASLSSIPDEDMDLDSFLGSVAMYVDKPEMFVGMAQMFLPQMEELQLVKNEPPKRIPDSMSPMPGVVAYAAMSDHALGIAVGQGEDALLPQFLNSKSNQDGSFLSMNYDLAAYMDRIDVLSEDWGQSAMEDYQRRMEESGQDADNDMQQSMAIAEAVRDSLRDMAGRNLMSFRFDESGIAVENQVTFKD